MKYFKVLSLVLVLSPVSVFATIIGDSDVSEYEDIDALYGVNMDEAFHSESIEYSTLDFLNANIGNATVTHETIINESDVFTTDLNVGFHTVPAEITALRVTTTPAPVTAWSMSTALLGLLTVGRRSKVSH